MPGGGGCVISHRFLQYFTICEVFFNKTWEIQTVFNSFLRCELISQNDVLLVVQEILVLASNSDDCILGSTSKVIGERLSHVAPERRRHVAALLAAQPRFVVEVVWEEKTIPRN